MYEALRWVSFRFLSVGFSDMPLFYEILAADRKSDKYREQPKILNPNFNFIPTCLVYPYFHFVTDNTVVYFMQYVFMFV